VLPFRHAFFDVGGLWVDRRPELFKIERCVLSVPLRWRPPGIGLAV
jgi:hypothetical protein